jgi:hypothetical protein
MMVVALMGNTMTRRRAQCSQITVITNLGILILVLASAPLLTNAMVMGRRANLAICVRRIVGKTTAIV